ncbi:CCN family member 2-like [Octopus vulgaris]|uniref:CCN family member 2-like n=1 Tax=Octopus vulgaris TaxID=6645 RepID=A0AA36EZL8_OCTVU|nr:CCN family member 2-like [Octopus vulgaris]
MYKLFADAGVLTELEQHKTHRFSALKGSEEFCEFPCQCPIEELICNEGVKAVKDGCDCCYMCARQHGDRCSPKERCADGLYCQLSKETKGVGICKARYPKPCEVHSSFYRNGKRVVKKTLYSDGEQVRPDCSHLCTCQNGNFGCVSLCPQEEKKPSLTHCKNPRLVTVAGQCCGEWWCDTDSNYTKTIESKSGSTSNVVAYDPRRDGSYVRHAKPSTLTQLPLTTTSPIRPPCAIVKSEWSACSASCGVGMSVRMNNDNLECEDVQQTRICFLRPCGEVVKSEKHKKCTPTAKAHEKYRIVFQDCRSVKEHRLKFCSNCKV